MNKIKAIFFFLFLQISVHQLIIAQYTQIDVAQYIEMYKDIAVNKMIEYKIPASITLAQGIFESACGTSRLATEAKNHFGIKCHTEWTGDTILIDDDALGECFRKYNSVEESFQDHSYFLTSRNRYSKLFELSSIDYKSWAYGLKEAGYATNPKYPERLIALIEKYKINVYDTLDNSLNKSLEEQKGTASKHVDKEKNNENLERTVYENQRVRVETLRKRDRSNNIEEKKQDEVVKKEIKPTDVKAVDTRKQAVVVKEQPILIFKATDTDFTRDNSPFTRRQVYTINRTYFIIATSEDTYEKIAEDVQLSVDKIRKYNDLISFKKYPEAGEVVFIETKGKANATDGEHIVVEGETLQYIAQKYGVQLSYILKFNNLSEDSIITAGDKINLYMKKSK